MQEASDDDAGRYALLIGNAAYLRHRECAFGVATGYASLAWASRVWCN